MNKSLYGRLFSSEIRRAVSIALILIILLQLFVVNGEFVFADNSLYYVTIYDSDIAGTSLSFGGVGVAAESENNAAGFKKGDEVVLNVCCPDDLYLKKLCITRTSDGGKVRFYSDGKTVSFTMPGEDVNVVPEFDRRPLEPEGEYEGDVFLYLNSYADESLISLEKFDPVDVMTVKQTIADESAFVHAGREISIDGLFPDDGINETLYDALLDFETGYCVLYDTGEENDYLIGLADSLRGDFTLRDFAFAEMNNDGHEVGGCIMDSDTGIVYIPKTLECLDYKNGNVNGLQAQLLNTVEGDTEHEIQVEINTDNLGGDFAESGTVRSDIYSNSLEILLAKDEDAKEEMEYASLNVSVNGIYINEDTYSYDKETGVISIAGETVNVSCIGIEVSGAGFSGKIARSVAEEFTAHAMSSYSEMSYNANPWKLLEGTPVAATSVQNMGYDYFGGSYGNVTSRYRTSSGDYTFNTLHMRWSGTNTGYGSKDPGSLIDAVSGGTSASVCSLLDADSEWDSESIYPFVVWVSQGWTVEIGGAVWSMNDVSEPGWGDTVSSYSEEYNKTQYYYWLQCAHVSSPLGDFAELGDESPVIVRILDIDTVKKELVFALMTPSMHTQTGVGVFRTAYSETVKYGELKMVKSAGDGNLMSSGAYDFSGVSYRVYDAPESGNMVGTLMIDSKTGESNTLTLPVGTYYIEEYSCNEKLVKNEGRDAVEVKENELTVFEKGIAVETLKSMELSLVKYAEEDYYADLYSLEGAVYDVYYRTDVGESDEETEESGFIKAASFAIGNDGRGYVTYTAKIGGYSPYVSEDGETLVIPWGEYAVLESGAPDSGAYIKSDEETRLWFSEDGVEFSGGFVSFENGKAKVKLEYTEEVIRGDFRFGKFDSRSKEGLENVSFRLSLLNNDGEVVESHELHTGEDGEFYSAEAEEEFYFYGKETEADETTGTGEINGTIETPGDDENTGANQSEEASETTGKAVKSGRLIYGNYVLEELPCEANENYYLTEPIYFSVTENDTVIDLGEVLNIPYPEIGTYARSENTGSNTADAVLDTLTDTVSMTGLIVGKTYTLITCLFNKSENDFIRNEDGDIMCVETEFTAEEENTEAEIPVDIDLEELAGDVLVFFEYLYSDGKMIAVHEDTEDADQTVTVREKKTETEETDDKNEEISEQDETSESEVKTVKVLGVQVPKTGDDIDNILALLAASFLLFVLLSYFSCIKSSSGVK